MSTFSYFLLSLFESFARIWKGMDNIANLTRYFWILGKCWIDGYRPFRRKKSIIASYTSFSFQIFQERRTSVPKLFRMIYNVRIIRLLQTGRATIIVRITENREEKLNRLELGWNISMAPERRLNLIRGTNGPETRILKGGKKSSDFDKV